MDKFDTSLEENIDNSNDNGETLTETAPSRYKYILYISLLVIFLLLGIWVIKVLVTNEPPLVVLNEMLNSTLQIRAASD